MRGEAPLRGDGASVRAVDQTGTQTADNCILCISHSGLGPLLAMQRARGLARYLGAVVILSRFSLLFALCLSRLWVSIVGCTILFAIHSVPVPFGGVINVGHGTFLALPFRTVL